MKINKTIKPATPWNVSIAKLTNLEKAIAASEEAALLTRWMFGRELVSRRVDYKGQLVIPRDLMALAIEKCGVSRGEIASRVRFAIRYPTKMECVDAVKTYPSWRQMTHEGLVEKKQAAARKRAPQSGFVLRRLEKEFDKAYAHHAALTRDDVSALERLLDRIKKILDQVDRNDKARAS